MDVTNDSSSAGSKQGDVSIPSSETTEETVNKWIEIQHELQKKILLADTEPWADDLDSLDLVGGLDISYSKQDETQAYACLVVFSIKSESIVYSRCAFERIETKYRPGFLAFKEVAPMLRLHEMLKNESPQLMPSVWIVDGNGVMHERGVGLASHFGVLIDEPTIGVSKTPLDGNFLCRRDKGLSERESLVYNGTVLVGACIIGGSKATKPVHVSIGNRVSLKTAIHVARVCCKHRVPEPTRHADILSREMLRRLGL